jgi:hypothetical protein
VRINTTSPKEWLDALKQHWDLSTTEMREMEEYIVVMHFSKGNNVIVGHYNKVNKKGYIVDRRSNGRR